MATAAVLAPPPPPPPPPPAPASAMTTLQRRYSVTGQTPPDDVGAMKSPKLQALDTSVQSTGCNLCGSGGDIVRTSSKRSATQLPSPNTPSSQELPTKIARLGLEPDTMSWSGEDGDDSLAVSWPEESDYALSSPIDTPPTSPPSSDCECLNDGDEGESLLVGIANADTAPTFLTLPPEIRQMIYCQLPDLVLPYPLIYCLSTFANKKQHPLASVSRVVRSEALAIFYSYNVWIIKLEFNIMYDMFQDWIIRLDEGAGSLRVVHIAVRGALFKPRTSHSSAMANGTLVQTPNGPAVLATPVEEYSPPDGDASFKIDLSEKWTNGKVELLRNDGTKEAGEEARVYLAGLVQGLWEKRRAGTLNGQDWITIVDLFLKKVGWH